MTRKLTLAVPSGIGDISWLVSRIWSVRDDISEIEVADGYPRRSHQYLDLLPWAHSYQPHDYSLIVTMEQEWGLFGDAASWHKAKLLGHARVFIEPNQHLEAGKPLATWLSDIPADETYYHYPLTTSDEHVTKASKQFASLPHGKPTVGISCASYRGAEAWHTWDRTTWIDCIRRIVAEGWHPVFVGGHWDDLTMDVAEQFENEATNLCAKNHFGVTVELLKRLDGYVGYSSGLNVIRTVLNKPAMALWPDFEGFSQEALSRSWAPPHMQEWETGRYIARLWRPLDDVWPTMRRFLRTCGDEIGKTLPPPCK